MLLSLILGVSAIFQSLRQFQMDILKAVIRNHNPLEA